MALWYRQHRDPYRLPWHLPSPAPRKMAVMGMRPAACGTTSQIEDRGFDEAEDPPSGDWCAACHAMFVRGEA